MTPEIPRKHTAMRRILHKLKIDEISAIDKPAQAGALAVIMKGVKPMVCDTEKGVVFTDAQIAKFAELQIAGEETTLTKDDWMTAIEERADTLYGDKPMTKAQRFSKCIGGMASTDGGSVVNDGDKFGKLYYEAYNAAPRAEPDAPPPPADFAKSEAAKRGPASVQMLELARAHNAANPKLSAAQSYDRVYTDARNSDLKQKMVAESAALWNGLQCEKQPDRPRVGLQ
jgi:hypothetical protein